MQEKNDSGVLSLWCEPMVWTYGVNLWCDSVQLFPFSGRGLGNKLLIFEETRVR